MMNTFLLLQYCLLNGYFIQRYFLGQDKRPLLETLTLSLLLSLSLNSLVLYFLNRIVQFPVTSRNVIILSLGMAGSILGVHLLISFRQRHEPSAQKTTRSA